MDSNNNHFEQEKRNEAHNISSDWQTHDSILANTALTYENPVALYKGNQLEASSSSSPMLNSFCTSVWDHSLNTLNMGPFNTNNLQNATTDLNTMGWSQFPADSGFIERAARFSSFGRENFGVINPYGGLESTNIRYDRVSSTNVIHQPKEVLPETELKSVSSEKSPKYEQTPLKNEEKSNNFGKSSEKGKRGVFVSRDESDETEFSGGGSEPSSSKSKRRKLDAQGNKLGEADGLSQPGGDFTEDNKGDQCSTLTSNANDTAKEGYIHMRARRGQATNSHSLAERVRREKISERMKLLQDLVPGCSKVTGKAFMLDEIINYVQLLQGQVEFLSMKLATVNPCLDFNLEGLLTKDILQSRSGPSSLLGYSPGITTMQLPSFDGLRRSISSQLPVMSEGYKLPVQVPGMWVDDELHNVVQMGLNSSAPLDIQDLNGSLP